MINYEEEQKKLDNFKPGEGVDFWKPKAGQHKVKALSELEDTEPFIEEGKEPKPQVKIALKVGEEEKVWTMAKGVSLASSYGQLVKLATGNGNILKDLEFTIVVVNDGKKNTYTIVG